MDDELFSELVEEIKGIKEELKKQNENMEKFSKDLMARLKEISNELSA